MLIYNLISTLCLLALAVQVIGLTVAYMTKSRAERVKMVRGFKNGPCGIIYVIAVPLYFIGYIYALNGVIGVTEVFDAFFDSLAKVFGLVILQYDLSDIYALISDSNIYAITVYSCSWLVFFNTVVFIFSLTSQRLSEFFNRALMLLTVRERLFVFGSDDNSVRIVESRGSRRAVLVEELTTERAEELYRRGIPYCIVQPVSIVDSVVRAARSAKRPITAVINTDNDARNMQIARAFSDAITRLSASDREKLYKRLSVYIFATPDHEEDYAAMLDRGEGILRCADKYRMIAVDFVSKYPLSFFLDSEQIDYESSLVRNCVDLNVIMLGFGDTNREIFFVSVANNQFIKKGIDVPEQKQVNYHIFDKRRVTDDADLNHTYYRIRNEIDPAEREKYLPLPDPIAAEQFYQIDVGSPEFYPTLRKILAENPLSANYVIIAVGSDIQNVNLAHKIIAKRREWGIDRLAIFVKASGAFKDEIIEKEKNCFFIGNLATGVYDVDKIINGRIERMSKMRNAIYDVEYAVKHEQAPLTDEHIREITDRSEHKWYAGLGRLKRDSNIYCCLSLRSKLNMMGLDICEDNEENKPLHPLSLDEYYAIYASDDKPDVIDGITANGKPIVNYSLNTKASRRTSMAIQEHLRWNSFMISRGFIPSTVEQILDELDGQGRHTDGRSNECRRHCNITTFKGLVEYRKMIAKRDGKSELECDVILYDYQLLDDAWWLANACGYKIIRIDDAKTATK